MTATTHKIITRPWGIECRFCCQRDGLPDANDTVTLAAVTDDPAPLIAARVAQIDAALSEPEAAPESESIFSSIEDDKERLKWQAVAAIRANPTLSAEGFAAALPWQEAGISKALTHAYAKIAVRKGMIPSLPADLVGCWDVLAGLVLALTDEQLREIL